MATRQQKNPYKGEPERPWIRVRLATATGTFFELELLADTGNPCALIIGDAHMAIAKIRDATDVKSNFGALKGGRVRIAMPALGIERVVVAYSSDAVSKAVKASHSDFDGLAGLPLLRLAKFGGDADYFWFKRR